MPLPCPKKYPGKAGNITKAIKWKIRQFGEKAPRCHENCSGALPAFMLG